MKLQSIAPRFIFVVWKALALIIACALVIASALIVDAAPTRTEISLREYVDARFDAMDKQTALALASVKEQTSLALTAAKEAVVKAELATDKRFDNTNEWRGALDDNQRLNMPRVEAEQQLKAIAEKLTELSTRMSAIEERSRGKNDSWYFLIAVAGGLASLAAIYMLLLRRPHDRRRDN